MSVEAPTTVEPTSKGAFDNPVKPSTSTNHVQQPVEIDLRNVPRPYYFRKAFADGHPECFTTIWARFLWKQIQKEAKSRSWHCNPAGSFLRNISAEVVLRIVIILVVAVRFLQMISVRIDQESQLKNG